MLIIDERIDDDGASVTTGLDVAGGALCVTVGGRVEGSLPFETLDIVMERYGRALADGVPLEGPALDLGGGRALRILRHRAHYDVLARDFLVLVRPGADSLAELTTAIASALVHLARAAAARESIDPR